MFVARSDIQRLVSCWTTKGAKSAVHREGVALAERAGCRIVMLDRPRGLENAAACIFKALVTPL